MKKTILFVALVILINTSVIAGTITTTSASRPLSQILSHLNSNGKQYYSQGVSIGKNNDPNDYMFSPEDIELKDDAFHGADTLHFTEWWYFDATFDNGYSAQMSIRVISAMNQGIVFSRLDIYKHGILVSHDQNMYLLNDFEASSDVPVIYLSGQQVINGYINQTTEEWIFDLSFHHDDASADLQFVGITKGWKGQLFGGDWWGVILPRAEVTGTITIFDEHIEVHGIGYHDHNWEVTAFAGVNFGWFWGKIHANNYTMTWSNILTTRIFYTPIVVVNEENDGYMNIESDKIRFTAEDFRWTNGRFTPHLFTLNADTSNISLDVQMEVLAVHHVRLMGVIHYWRFHVRCTGSITVDSQVEPIDKLQIAEFIRFR